MLFADKNRYFLTSAFYEGFKILIHHPEDFASVRDRGFVVPPGVEMFVAVDAMGLKVEENLASKLLLHAFLLRQTCTAPRPPGTFR